ncbi:hypothetical protein ABZ863_01785 [Saccharomonospora sp. NPDC046836]|uniref:hypothetical protein n=1 Tax=Saccharomonospora sp. NPDC046836 TaxID=3156921 RepID=UPI0033C3C646
MTAQIDPEARLAELNARFRGYARHLAEEQLRHWSPKGISDLDDEAFVEQVTDELFALITREDVIVMPPDERRMLDLFGFGRVQEVLTEVNVDTVTFGVHGYVWGHEVAEALGWDAANFAEWARDQWKWDLVTQREEDVQTGTVGWECIRHHPMRVDVWQGEGRSDDHYVDGRMSGPITRYWCDLYLIHTDRIMSMMLNSPWGKEFMDSVIPLMSHAMRASGLEERAKDVPTYRTHVNSLGEVETEVAGSLADMFARDREGISEEEARRRAFRGPVTPSSEEP